MAPKEQQGGGRPKGFASLNDETKKRVASQGGLASAKGKKTSNRGFASMDKRKQREISRLGGKASRNAQGIRRERNEEDAEQKDIISDKDTSTGGPALLRDDPESSEETQEALDYSETDEDEDEGLGDGNLGRSTRGGVYGK